VEVRTSLVRIASASVKGAAPATGALEATWVYVDGDEADPDAGADDVFAEGDCACSAIVGEAVDDVVGDAADSPVAVAVAVVEDEADAGWVDLEMPMRDPIAWLMQARSSELVISLIGLGGGKDRWSEPSTLMSSTVSPKYLLRVAKVTRWNRVRMTWTICVTALGNFSITPVKASIGSLTRSVSSSAMAVTLSGIASCFVRMDKMLNSDVRLCPEPTSLIRLSFIGAVNTYKNATIGYLVFNVIRIHTHETLGDNVQAAIEIAFAEHGRASGQPHRLNVLDELHKHRLL